VYQSDWLLRQIEQMGDALRRLMDALREHRPADAIEHSREAVRELLDTDPGMIDALTGEGLVTLLSAGGALDTFRAHMLGELLLARAEAHAMAGQAAEAVAERERARTLLEAVLPLAEGADAARVRELLGFLGE
jgi:hypothetical protein